MIILTRLQASDFKSLRDIDLLFPLAGSILVEGLNEAGKSTLFEAIYFALYGEPLIGEETSIKGRTRHETAIRHGAERARVVLSLDVDGTALVVERNLRRTKGRNTASLLITRSDGEQESVSETRAVNDRLLMELGNLDKEALLNSCFVEQKKLAKLEELGGSDRQSSLAHLLNLDKLESLEKEFKVSAQDHRDIALAERRYDLAVAQATLPRLDAQLRDVLRRRAAAEIHAALDNVDEQNVIIQNRSTEQKQIAVRLSELLERRNRIEAVKQARRGLSELIRKHEDLARQQTQIASEQRRIEELDRREREEKPTLEVRIAALDRLHTGIEQGAALADELGATASKIREQQEALTDLVERSAKRDRLTEEVAQQSAEIKRLEEKRGSDQEKSEAELRALQPQLIALDALGKLFSERWRLAGELERARDDEARMARDAAAHGQLLADIAAVERERDDLTARVAEAEATQTEAERVYKNEAEARRLESWLAGQRARLAVEGHEAALAEGERRSGEAEVALADKRQGLARDTQGVIAAAVIAGLLLIASLALFILNLAPVGAVLLLLALMAALWAFRAYSAVRQAQVAVKEAEETLAAARQKRVELAAERAAAATMGAGAERIAEAENELRLLGATIPTTTEEAESRLSTLRRAGAAGDSKALRLAVEAARDAHRELAAQLAGAATRRLMLQRQAETHPGADSAAHAQLTGRIASMATQLDELAAQIATHNAEGIPTTIALEEAKAALGAQIAEHRQILATLPSRQEHIESLKHQLATTRQTLEAEQQWLAGRNSAELEAAIAALETQRSRQLETKKDHDARITSQAAELGVQPITSQVSREHGSSSAELNSLQKELDHRSLLMAQLAQFQEKLSQDKATVSAAWRALLPLPENVTAASESLSDTAQLADLDDRLDDRLQALNEADVALQSDELNRKNGELGTKINTAQSLIMGLQIDIEELLRQERVDAIPKREAIAAAFAEYMAVSADQVSDLTGQAHDLEVEERTTIRKRDELARELNLGEEELEELDEQAVRAEMETLRHDRDVRQQAVKIVSNVRQRMIDRVLPNTERNMAQLLPPLTMDRYRDAKITSDYKLQIWDEQAGRYVAKNIFSGGARDQFSLALRLAFALATLPEELGTTPGFLFLDEPLSSFDAQRSAALINLLTQGQIAANFRQIFVISHNLMFDRAAFTHHLLMDNGRVAEHDFAAARAPSEG